MILTKEQTKEMLEAARPLMKWISDNCHPHCAATVGAGSIELSEVVACEITVTNEAKRNEDTVEPLVRLVIGIIKNHEDDLSDGFGYYGGKDGVECTAREIVAALKLNEQAHFRACSEAEGS